MKEITTTCLFSIALFFAFISALILEKKYSLVSKVQILFVHDVSPLWDNTDKKSWNSSFKEISITSSLDGASQKAYSYQSKDINKPLIISLHTWSGDYQQQDPLSELAKENNWNYLHPDFRGPNNRPDACLSELAIQDIDDAISYAIDNFSVDEDNVFIIGVSGGGYATLGSYIKTKHKIKRFISWVPISDLNSWYHQTKQRGLKYSSDIEKCLDFKVKMLSYERSPLTWDLPHDLQKIEIYAGVEDGYNGSVPTSHAILFYNKISNNKISLEEALSILSKELIPTGNKIEERDILFEKRDKNASLIIFDGGHEMLAKHTFDRIKEIIQ